MKTPNKMIGGIAGAMAQQGGAIDQSNQVQQTPINPQLLTKGFNPQVLTGTPQPGVSYNNLMPDPSTPLNQGKQTFGILNAKTSEEAAVAEAKRLEAQKKAREKRDKKEEKDPVSGNTMFISTPRRTYRESSSKIIYNEDGSVSKRQTIK